MNFKTIKGYIGTVPRSYFNRNGIEFLRFIIKVNILKIKHRKKYCIGKEIYRCIACFETADLVKQMKKGDKITLQVQSDELASFAGKKYILFKKLENKSKQKQSADLSSDVLSLPLCTEKAV